MRQRYREQPVRIKTAIRWSNGMVMVFDQYGHQVQRLQGRYDTVRAQVLAAADAGTEFRHGVWNEESPLVRREEW